MDKTNKLSQLESRAKSVSKKTGWDIEKAKEALVRAKQEYGIRYYEYDNKNLFEYPEEELAKIGEELTAKRNKQKIREENHIKTIMDDMGISHEDAKAMVVEAKKEMGIPTKAFVKNNIYRLPKEKWALAYDESRQGKNSKLSSFSVTIASEAAKKIEPPSFGFLSRFSKNAKIEYDLETVCRIIGVPLPDEYKAERNRKINRFALRFNQLKPGCVFFCHAWSYARLNEKLIQEIKDNDAFVITSKPIEGCRNIICDNIVKRALVFLNYMKNQYDVKTIAVTGSVGKTSCKDMIGSVLRQKYKDQLLMSSGNSNSYQLVSLNVQNLTKNIKVYLQEVGLAAEFPVTVENSAIIIEPDIVVYTNIKDNHIEGLGSREGIAKAKFTLSDHGKRDGLAVVNYDDDILREHKFVQKKVTYSLHDENADYYSKDISISSNGTTFTLVDSETGKELSMSTQLIGEHQILNILTAYIVGKYTDVSEEQIIRGVESFRTSGVRQNLINFGAYSVLADCYNSAFDAIQMIIPAFDQMKAEGDGRKIVVLGDILELGDRSERIHHDVGKYISEFAFDTVIFQGEEMKYAYDEYKAVKDNALYFDNRDDMIQEIRKMLKPNDFLIFKASHSMMFSEAIDTLFGSNVGEISSLQHKHFQSECDDNYEYYIFSEHASILKYTGNSKHVVVPKEYKGMRIEKILSRSFEKANIERVTLPEHLVRLGSHCFEKSRVKEVVFNSELRQISTKAFAGCNNLESIDLPDSLLVISSGAFKKCKRLSHIYIGPNTRIINKSAFSGCKRLVLECEKDSFAHEYAIENGIKYTLK